MGVGLCIGGGGFAQSRWWRYDGRLLSSFTTFNQVACSMNIKGEDSIAIHEYLRATTVLELELC